MDKCSLFYFHGGNSYYLPYTINQTKKYNGENPIIFLGDKHNNHVTKFGIVHADYNDYFESANRFAKLYKHLSCNSEYTELKCFQRWISVAEYCEKNNIDGPIVLLDSDVLLYCSLDEYFHKYFAEYDMGVCGEYGPGYVFFRTPEIIKRLADFIITYYSNDEKRQSLQAEYAHLQEISGGTWGICDMNLMDRFIKEEHIRALDLCEVRDGCCFDNHLGKKDARFPLNQKGIKTIIMRETVPHCTNVLTGEEVRLLSLHFQGARKEIMYRYYTGDKKKVQPLPFAVCRELFQMTKRKAKRFLKKIK